MLTKETVEHVARLANLDLDADEVAFYQEHLKKILSYVDQLDQFDDKLDSDWRHDTLAGSTSERRDRVASMVSVEDSMRQAPESSGTAFKVPRVIES